MVSKTLALQLSAPDAWMTNSHQSLNQVRMERMVPITARLLITRVEMARIWFMSVTTQLAWVTRHSASLNPILRSFDSTAMTIVDHALEDLEELTCSKDCNKIECFHIFM